VILSLLLAASMASADTPTVTTTRVPTATPTAAPHEIYEGRVTSVTDGDTVQVSLSLGWGIVLNEKVRLHGINAPELSTAAGVAAKAYLQGQVTSAPEIRFRSFKDKRDKYGRVLLELFVVYDDGTTFSLNDRMVETGNAIRATY
jgi:endonuclease YncB( thermonuclease family)